MENDNMINILKKIFIEHNFEIEDNFEVGFLALKQKKEYFFVMDYSEEEVENFFECDKTDNLLASLEEKADRYTDIHKNISLIICCRTDYLNEYFENYRNIIFKIEEDEYYFRKYIVAYTEDVYAQLNSVEDICVEINRILLVEGGIDEFQKNYFSNELYHVAMQLMVKLPFLTVNQNTREFVPLNQLLEEKIGQIGLNEFNLCLEALNELDYDYERLEEAMLSEVELIEMTDFFNCMGVEEE